MKIAMVVCAVGLATLCAGDAQQKDGGLSALRSTQNVPSAAPREDDVEILSDTRGVDFRPYLKKILPTILEKYLEFLPEKVRAPTFASGLTLVRFSINPDGKIGAMHLDASTHDEAIDRAARGAITNQKQFPPLPATFTGPNLELRLNFNVNTPANKRIISRPGTQ